ncbi:hypothetical protein [Nocardioides currus]|uniref:DNA-directed RNA polymerase subunit beta n=1 Tax=Nocardioides currus TaxID=2133958 RepID=A0A2R7Z191_9ACTN|nr:hypothetical protein [Nocardioides currus]PUA82397.1 hypothetical protein C7S10_01210 [Nocardioides currus]
MPESDAPRHHRPRVPGAAFFEELTGGADPAEVREAGDLAATILVRGARGTTDEAMTERVLHLADTEGLETLAEVWSGAPADTLAGCLWRLYVLRAWVHRSPAQAAREYDAGLAGAPVARVVAGVADPPGPDEVKTMIDAVLRGIVGDFAVTLLRAAAFARVVATGRASASGANHTETMRMLALSEQLEAAGHLELRDSLS